MLNVRMFHLRLIGYRSEETYKCTSCSVYRLQSSFTFLPLSFFLIFRSPLHGDLLLLYSLLELIKTLHLLAIWTFTWVSVPSDISLILLWVALANVTLFVCLLHINAAEKVAFLHLMRQLWLLPDVLHFPLSYCVRLTLLPTFAWMGSSLWRGRTLGPYSCVRGGIPPRTPFGSNRAQQGWARRCSGPYSLLGHGWALCGSPGPFVDFGEFHPYIVIRNVWFIVMCSWCNAHYNDVTLRFSVYFIFSNIIII